MSIKQINSVVVTLAEFADAESLTDEQFLRYTEMRAEDQSHNIAMVLASRHFPGVKTDSVFNEGKFSGSDGRIDAEQNWLRKQAEDAGVSTNGKWYCHGLATKPGDPTAWIDGRADVERIAREKNLTVHGYVEHKGIQVEPMADVGIDPRLVKAEADAVFQANPGSKYEEVYERVHDVRSGKLDLNPEPSLEDM